MSKVTLRELREEARRVFCSAALVCEETFAGAHFFAVVIDERSRVEWCSHRSRMAARRLALACLRAMQPINAEES